MKIKFNEVTWYSKLAAIFVLLGVLPTLTFYMGKEYGEVTILSNQPVYISEQTPAQLQKEINALQSSNPAGLRFFTQLSSGNETDQNTSNIVGYFAHKNFFFYIPQWLPDNWEISDLQNGGIIFSPKDGSGIDFSDINIAVATTTEIYNADTLYTKEAVTKNKALCIAGSRCEVRDPNSKINVTEILISKIGDTRIYHIEKDLGNGFIQDEFFIDGKKLTATITFSANKESYNFYEDKVREFVQGIGSGELIRG